MIHPDLKGQGLFTEYLAPTRKSHRIAVETRQKAVAKPRTTSGLVPREGVFLLVPDPYCTPTASSSPPLPYSIYIFARSCMARGDKLHPIGVRMIFYGLLNYEANLEERSERFLLPIRLEARGVCPA